MALHIVLIEPEIPNNTGNIGRLALASGAELHLVKPFGFEINDTRLKRAGLDYWDHLPVHYYENSEAFFRKHEGKSMAFLSSHGASDYWDIPYEEDLFLIFGKESVGLPKTLLKKHIQHTYKIPIFSPHVRSLNLANAVSIVVYEGLNQLKHH
ncbi:tRNA (cytidine(34)-2'-O)-methyltransferase [Gaetbulibacter aestuarii]|uniref:Putative tRNA (cytidine(34)-2'-O)-methyltransferase n=1 Tax=Gaetbulibacter aestuarii TaxID=1502358 RepID=A0ABW7N1G1_9FLAO